MAKMRSFLVWAALLLVSVGIVLLGCSSNDNSVIQPPCEGPDCFDGTESSSDNIIDPSSSSEGQLTSSETVDISSSSGQLTSSSSISISSSSGTTGPSSSSEMETPGANCAYMSIWCGGIAFDRVKTNYTDLEVGNEDRGQERPTCIYAREITMIGNESGGISINGTTFANGSASRCGGDSGHGWGDTQACATKFSSIPKRDGGYYIYVPRWAGQNFVTVGGEPICTGSTPSSSSSQTTTSSSSAGSGGTCVEPMYGVPPGGITSCVKKGDECYTCNPDRGTQCNQPWIWQVDPVQDYWHSKVDCNETGNIDVLTCTGLASTGTTGTAITRPTVQCNGTNVANATFAGAPTWNNPTASTYNVSATANCGGSKTVSCGSIVVSTPTTNQLTCTGLAATGIAGTAITQPTVRCNNSAVTATFTGDPAWTNPVAGSFNVTANASCGGSNTTASCGTIVVSPRLTCGNPTPATVIAGTNVTPPAVQCGGTAITSGFNFAGAPTYWTNPAQGTYNNIRATATSGNCNGQTATCGTLTVNPRLTCATATATITVGQTPPKPAVTCGTTNVAANSITWSPSAMNNVATGAGSIVNITAAASCGGSNQTATCAGSITINAQTSSSSSTGGGTSSSSTGGGSSTYTIRPAGSNSSPITHYWDACKPSCSWNGNAGGNPSRNCNIDGTNRSLSDNDPSSCDGGAAFTCMNQAPWTVPYSGVNAPTTGRISFGYVAANRDACGTCYQLNFPNGEVMVVMKTNIGDIRANAVFDLMVPGGGVGDFNALTRQIQHVGPANPQMGVQYGGFRGACNWGYSAANATCVRNMCNAAFANLPLLRAGCNWYVDVLGTDEASWNNPTVRWQIVDCPSELRNRY